MPSRPPTHKPHTFVDTTREDARREFDHRRADDPYRALYKTAQWDRTRKYILSRDPICGDCHERPSTIVDHIVRAIEWIKRYGGDVAHFFDTENLQGLCKQCHDSKTAKECGFAGRKS